MTFSEIVFGKYTLEKGKARQARKFLQRIGRRWPTQGKPSVVSVWLVFELVDGFPEDESLALCWPAGPGYVLARLRITALVVFLVTFCSD